MSDLSNNQLLLLDNLIYLKFKINKYSTVRDEINFLRNEGGLDTSKNKNGKLPCLMSKGEWFKILDNIEQDKELLSMKIANYYEEKSGTKAACFIDNNNNINVVFRGTFGDYEWHDDGEGGFLSDTTQQESALSYINELPYKNITVTGHSKGGNKAQYAAILSDKVKRCVSFDGQGFSNEFTKKYFSGIEENKNKILSICAKNDFINSLLIPIAGNIKYINTVKQEKFIYNHKPNIVFDKDGKLLEETEQGELPRIINKFTIHFISEMKEPKRSFVINGLVGFMEDTARRERRWQSFLALNIAVSYLEAYALEIIKKHYGPIYELSAAEVAAIICPMLFLNNFYKAEINNSVKLFNKTLNEMKETIKVLSKTLEKIDTKNKHPNKIVPALNDLIYEVEQIEKEIVSI